MKLKYKRPKEICNWTYGGIRYSYYWQSTYIDCLDNKHTLSADIYEELKGMYYSSVLELRKYYTTEKKAKIALEEVIKRRNKMRVLARKFVDKLVQETPTFKNGELVWKQGVKEVRVTLTERFLFFRKPSMKVRVNKVPLWLPLFQRLRLRRYTMKLLYNRIVGQNE